MNPPDTTPADMAALQRTNILMTASMLNAGGNHSVALASLLNAYVSLLLAHPCCYEGGLKALALVTAAVQGAQALTEGAAPPPGDAKPTVTRH